MIKTAQDAYLAGRQAALEKLSMSVEDKRDYFRKGLEERMNEQNYTAAKVLGTMGALGGLAFGSGKGRLINSLKGLGLGGGSGLLADLDRPSRYQRRIDDINAASDQEVERRYEMAMDLQKMLQKMREKYDDKAV